ncbi:MAG: histidine--tRNA ligase [Coriobacteriia bacterium]|nr:histidine--tRNA ligase [Coriobacteriia bacterium]
MAQNPTYQAPKGTVDLTGDSARAWEYLNHTAAQVFSRYGYELICTPIFEATEVFARGIGAATDVVNKEMYSFKDKKGRSLTLRPENTAGVVRAAIQGNLAGEAGLAKLYYAGPMFRYERPQKGRQRQFYQIGAEALGPASPEADAEMILMLWNYFCTLGLPVVNMELLVNSMGCPQCRPAYREHLADYLRDHTKELCPECQTRADTNPLRAFDCKNPQCQTVLATAPKLSDALCDDCASHQRQVTALLEAAGVTYTPDPTLVRGLDYYTRTVFEVQIKDGLGAQNALGGGGRYDGLFEQLGGKPTPGIGFALGFERVALALDAANQYLFSAGGPRVCYVAAADAALRGRAFGLAQTIRTSTQKWAALCDLQNKSLKAQFKAADRAGAAVVVIVGADEFEAGQVRMRNMQTHAEELIAFDGVARWLDDHPELQGASNQLSVSSYTS